MNDHWEQSQTHSFSSKDIQDSEMAKDTKDSKDSKDSEEPQKVREKTQQRKGKTVRLSCKIVNVDDLG